MTSLVSGKTLEVRALKIVAGLEAEKTNLFLQALASAASSGKDSSGAVRQVLAGKVESGASGRARPKEAAVDPEKEKEKVSGEREKTSERPRKADGDRDKEKEREREKRRAQRDAEHEAEKEKQRRALKEERDGERAQQDEEKERERRRKERKERAAAMEAEKEKEREKEQAAAAAAEKESTMVGDRMEISEAPRSSDARPARPTTARRAPPKLPTNVKSVVGGGTNEGNKAGPKEGSGGPSGLKDAPVLSAGHHHPSSSSTSSAGGGGGGGATAAPMAAVSVIVDDGPDEEEEEEPPEVGGEVDGGGLGLRAQDTTTPQSGNPTEQQGALVRDIMREEKSLSQEGGKENGPRLMGRTSQREREKEKGGKDKPTGIILDSRRRKEKLSAAGEIDKLRGSVQSLCRAANPLGKCMDYLSEDMDLMSAELQGWRSESRSQWSGWKDEAGKTNGGLEPLQQELSELDEQIRQQRLKNNALKATIFQNDDHIQSLLNNITQGHSRR